MKKDLDFCTAAELGNLDLLKGIWNSLEATNEQSIESQTRKDRQTPLHLAACNGHLEVVQFLVETCGYNPNYKIQDRECEHTPFYIACENGKLDVARYLWGKLPPEQQNIDAHSALYWTPLDAAAHEGYLEVVKFLVEECSSSPAESGTINDDEDGDGIGYTNADRIRNHPFYLACFNGKFEIVEYLSTKPDIFIEDSMYIETGFSSLGAAVLCNHTKIAKFLIEKCGMDPTSDNHHMDIEILPSAILNSTSKSFIEFLVKEHKCTPDKVSLLVSINKKRQDIFLFLMEYLRHDPKHTPIKFILDYNPTRSGLLLSSNISSNFIDSLIDRELDSLPLLQKGKEPHYFTVEPNPKFSPASEDPPLNLLSYSLLTGQTKTAKYFTTEVFTLFPGLSSEDQKKYLAHLKYLPYICDLTFFKYAVQKIIDLNLTGELFQFDYAEEIIDGEHIFSPGFYTVAAYIFKKYPSYVTSKTIIFLHSTIHSHHFDHRHYFNYLSSITNPTDIKREQESLIAAITDYLLDSKTDLALLDFITCLPFAFQYFTLDQLNAFFEKACMKDITLDDLWSMWAPTQIKAPRRLTLPDYSKDLPHLKDSSTLTSFLQQRISTLYSVENLNKLSSTAERKTEANALELECVMLTFYTAAINLSHTLPELSELTQVLAKHIYDNFSERTRKQYLSLLAAIEEDISKSVKPSRKSHSLLSFEQTRNTEKLSAVTQALWPTPYQEIIAFKSQLDRFMQFNSAPLFYMPFFTLKITRIKNTYSDDGEIINQIKLGCDKFNALKQFKNSIDHITLYITELLPEKDGDILKYKTAFKIYQNTVNDFLKKSKNLPSSFSCATENLGLIQSLLNKAINLEKELILTSDSQGSYQSSEIIDTLEVYGISEEEVDKDLPMTGVSTPSTITPKETTDSRNERQRASKRPRERAEPELASISAGTTAASATAIAQAAISSSTQEPEMQRPRLSTYTSPE